MTTKAKRANPAKPARLDAPARPEIYPETAALMRQATKLFKSQNAMAEALGISRPYCSELCTGQKKPGPVVCRRVEQQTKGKIKAVRLRPDLRELFQ